MEKQKKWIKERQEKEKNEKGGDNMKRYGCDGR